MKLDLSRYVRPFAHPSAVIAESVLLPLLVVGLGIWFNPLDPLWVRGAFPWAWLAPMVLALRYGPLPGLAATGVLLAAWLAFSASGWLAGEFPKIYFLGGLIVIMLCGEFSSLWVARARRAEGVQVYLDQRLEYLTHQYYLLRMSHDRLEQDLLSRPMAMRDALSTLNAPAPADAADALPGAAALMRLLAQYCQIEAASLHPVRAGAADAAPVACIGPSAPFDAGDPLLRHALEEQTLAHVAQAQAAGARPSRYLIAAPLMTFDKECVGVLAVEKIPFFALNDEILQTINLLLGYFTDGLVRQRGSAALRAAVPDCPPDFAFELQRVWRLREQSGVKSVVVALAYPAQPGLDALAQQIARQKRGLDALWLVETPTRRALATLMPFSGAAAAEGYLARIEVWMRQHHGKPLAEAGILAHVLPIDDLPPAALLQHLFDACHVPAEARAPRTGA